MCREGDVERRMRGWIWNEERKEDEDAESNCDLEACFGGRAV